MLVVHGVQVRRPVRRLGLGLVAVSDENPAPSVIRVPHQPAGAVPVYGSQKTPAVSIRAEARLTAALVPTAVVVCAQKNGPP